MEFCLTPRGEVKDLVLVQSSGSAILDQHS
ncbi:energy transducer TonB [Wolinella succinogenes]